MYYVPYTKGYKLKKTLQNIEDRSVKHQKTGRVRILERLGPSIKEDLSNPTQWKNSHCGRTRCIPCKTKEGACKSRSIVYQIDCLDCLNQGVKSQYLGESHRTLCDRIEGHISGLQSQLKTNALYKQWRNFHDEQKSPPEFQVKRLGSY